MMHILHMGIFFPAMIGELHWRIHGMSSQQLACSDREHGPSVLK